MKLVLKFGTSGSTKSRNKNTFKYDLIYLDEPAKIAGLNHIWTDAFILSLKASDKSVKQKLKHKARTF